MIIHIVVNYVREMFSSELPPIIQKKVCVLGACAVGKTSLVQRCAESIFSHRYQTTVGVQISKKIIRLRKIGRTYQAHLILWDLAGEDDVHQIRTSYLRGSAGYLLVVDGTRRATLDTALRIQQLVVDTVGNVPFVLLLNKVDLRDAWEMEGYMHELASRGWRVVQTSAKTGVGVEEAFVSLCKGII